MINRSVMGGCVKKRKRKGSKISKELSKLRDIKWSEWSMRFKNKFYHDHPDVENRPAVLVKQYRIINHILTNGYCAKPILHFKEVSFPVYCMNEIKRQGFVEPTPTQAICWPIAMRGRSLLGITKTGSGKTLAYMLPAIVHITNQPPLEKGDGPIALVLAPTRELAQQIQKVASDFTFSSSIRNTCVSGGTPKQWQEYDLQRGCEIVIATPGRLIDLLIQGITNLRRCTYLVLDEADKMLEMGFEPQIRKIMGQIRPNRQLLMWSAIHSIEVEQIAKEYFETYTVVNVGTKELSANHNIKQVIKICRENEKEEKLKTLLSDIYDEAEPPGKIIIFVATKLRADKVSQFIRTFGVEVGAIHGDKCQNERDAILGQFRTGKTDILVATDLAARGLDVDGVKYVINFDFPPTTEDYIYRIGRTGRLNSTGTSYSFFTIKNTKQSRSLIKVLREAFQEIDPQLERMALRVIAGEPPSFQRYRITEEPCVNLKSTLNCLLSYLKSGGFALPPHPPQRFLGLRRWPIPFQITDSTYGRPGEPGIWPTCNPYFELGEFALPPHPLLRFTGPRRWPIPFQITDSKYGHPGEPGIWPTCNPYSELGEFALPPHPLLRFTGPRRWPIPFQITDSKYGRPGEPGIWPTCNPFLESGEFALPPHVSQRFTRSRCWPISVKITDSKYGRPGGPRIWPNCNPYLESGEFALPPHVSQRFTGSRCWPIPVKIKDSKYGRPEGTGMGPFSYPWRKL